MMDSTQTDAFINTFPLLILYFYEAQYKSSFLRSSFSMWDAMTKPFSVTREFPLCVFFKNFCVRVIDWN